MTTREWGEENGRNGRCVACGEKTWIEFGCAALCPGCDEPKESEEPEEPEEPEESSKVRDIRHEQVSQSTDAELADRLLELGKRERYSRYGTPDEYHAITSEMYCRAKGIKSQPWIHYMVWDATVLSAIKPGKRLVRV